MGTEPVDLNTCKPGDMLLTKQLSVVEYVRKLPVGSFYDHEIRYLDGQRGNGTRTNNGQVFWKNRLPTDEDIIAILPVFPESEYEA